MRVFQDCDVKPTGHVYEGAVQEEVETGGERVRERRWEVPLMSEIRAEQEGVI